MRPLPVENWERCHLTVASSIRKRSTFATQVDLWARQIVRERLARVRGQIASDQCRSVLITRRTHSNALGPGGVHLCYLSNSNLTLSENICLPDQEKQIQKFMAHWKDCQRSFQGELKGEVPAVCRFWVFDGNGLLGHRRIDSRWFEKNPPTESGWKRRSKKTPTYRYFARKWSWRNLCFQVRAISSRLWFTYIFAFDSGCLSIAGGLRKCGTLLIFCQTVVLVCLLLLPEEQEARVKRFAVAHFRKRPEIDPSGRLRMAMWPLRGPDCSRLCSGKLACMLSPRTNASSSVPSLHFFS